MSSSLPAMLCSLGLAPLTPDQENSFERYLELLCTWNERMNLTSVRDREAILRRHFVESIQCARLLPHGITSLLDYGSGGGFPGVPCGICRPDIVVTLAESQSKKAAFLREAVRVLQLRNVRVHAERVADLPKKIRFDAVTLRAVDRMSQACTEAAGRVIHDGYMAIMTTAREANGMTARLGGFVWQHPQPLAGTEQQVLLLGRLPTDVPRGT